MCSIYFAGNGFSLLVDRIGLFGKFNARDLNRRGFTDGSMNKRKGLRDTADSLVR